MNKTGSFKTNQGVLILIQTAAKVNGKYSETGVLEGIISGNIIRGNWKNSGKEGLFEFIFSEDLSFNGKYKVGLEPGVMRGKWDGKLIADSQIEHAQESIHVNNHEIQLVGEKKHGKCKWIDEDGDVFDGIWENNFFVNGKISYHDGGIDEGEFNEDGLNGIGKSTYKDEDGELIIEQGVWKDGVLIKGTIIKTNDDIQEGEFNEEGLNGEGKHSYKGEDGELIIEQGVWKDGIFIKGTITSTNDYIQEGEFNEEGLNGEGKYSYKDESGELIIEEGVWKDGVLIKGTVTFDDGSKTEGEFNEEGLNGKGLKIFNDGSFEKGIFKDGGLIEGICKKYDVDELAFEEKWIDGKAEETISPDLKDEKNMLIIGGIIEKRGKSAISELYIKSYTHIKEENDIYNLAKPEVAKLFDLILDTCLAFYKFKNLEKPIGNISSVQKGNINLVNQEIKEGPKTKKINFDSGDIYIGEYDSISNKRNGYGGYFWKSGDYYEGDFKDGKRTGKGIYIWPNGNCYVGDFINGNRTGWGTYCEEVTGKYATGKFIDGEPEKPFQKDYLYYNKNISTDLSVFFKSQSRGFDFFKKNTSRIFEEMPKINCENSGAVLKNISCDFVWGLIIYSKYNGENIEQIQPGVKINLESIFSNTAPRMINEITQTEFYTTISNEINSQVKTSEHFFNESLKTILENKTDLPHIERRQGNNLHNLLDTKGYHPIVVGNLYVHPINEESIIEDIMMIFMGLGLIEQSAKKRSVHDKETYWKLTEKGKKMMVDIKMEKLI